MDKETTRQLDAVGEVLNLSRSEVARLGIEKLYKENVKD